MKILKVLSLLFILNLAFTKSVEAVAPRVNITTSGTTYTCTEPIKGITITANNVNVRGRCQVQDAVTNGLSIVGNNVDIEWIDIDGVTRSGGDVDYARAHGDNIKIHGGVWKNIVCQGNTGSDVHCDGLQNWGQSGKPALTNSLLENVEIYNFGGYWYKDSNGNDVYSKSNCIQLESDSGNVNNTTHDVTIRNNVLNCYKTAEIGDPDDDGTTYNIHFLNNTVVGRVPNPNPTVGQAGIQITKGSNVTAYRNIFYNLVGTYAVSSVNAGENLVYRTDTTTLNGTRHSSDLWAVNPLLDAGYRPASNSPVCAKGWGAFPCGGGAATIAPTSSATPIYNIADVNKDGSVNLVDVTTVIANFGSTGSNGFIPSDILKNGVIDIFDFNKVIANFGK